MLLRWRREGRSDAFVLGTYLTSAGVIRFGIEFLRVHQSIMGPLALAHLLSVAAVCVGVVLLSKSRGPVGR
jgi:prolipoprotein diacylglyceryltransferase